jgi:hypothetical protein
MSSHFVAALSCPIAIIAAQSNYEQVLQPRKGSEEFDLEHNLELALHLDCNVIPYRVQRSHPSSTLVN